MFKTDKKGAFYVELPSDLINKIDSITKEREEFIIKAIENELKMQNYKGLTIEEFEKLKLIDRDEEFLNRYIDRLETDLEFWKDKYEVLQLEYYDQVRDSIKRLDSKFERLMSSIDETRQKPILESDSLKPNFVKDETKKKKSFSFKDIIKKESKSDDFQNDIDELLKFLRDREDNFDISDHKIEGKKSKEKKDPDIKDDL